MYAWGYNEKDPATNLVFTSKGGISDWGGILLGLQDRGILPPAETNETAEQVDANTEKAKAIVLNNQDTNLESIQESAELDLITTEGYDILRANDFTDEKLQSMSVKEINDKLIELAPKSAEPELTEEQLAGIPDDLAFQAAMYNNPRKNIKNFVQFVLDNPQNKKSYQNFTVNGITVLLPSDTILHDKNGHDLTAEDWKNVINSLYNIQSATETNKTGIYGNSILLQTELNGIYYGIAIEINKKGDNIITTAFNDNINSIKNWINNAGRPQSAAANSAKAVKFYTFGQPTFDKIINKLKQNVNTEENNNLQLQTAYAGSRVDYDRPSLEAIGSGEGNQAHGWGLYYALNKDVADNYRIVFTRQGQYDLAHRKLYSEHLWGTSRKETIQNLLEEIKEAQRRYKENDYFQTRGNTKESWKNYINDLIGALEIIQDENLTYNNFEHKDGQVHEVDIPEMDVLLDEQKTFDKQPQFVQETIKKVLKETDERLLNDLTNDRTGGYIYEGLSYILGSDKQASQLLDKYGIKGITYDGREDGRCFVIFNENSVKVLRKKFDKLGNVQFQNNQVGKGGAYDPTTRSITLGGKADATTLPHELAHYWIDKNFKWARSGKASQEWKRQWQAVEKWLGIDPEDKVLSKQASEKFARAYEKFLGEEKAPLVLEKKKHYDNIVVI